jgi:hypothetical protein
LIRILNTIEQEITRDKMSNYDIIECRKENLELGGKFWPPRRNRNRIETYELKIASEIGVVMKLYQPPVVHS